MGSKCFPNLIRGTQETDQKRRPLRRHQLWSAVLFPIPSPKAYVVTNLWAHFCLSVIHPSIHMSVCLPIFVSLFAHLAFHLSFHIFIFIYSFVCLNTGRTDAETETPILCPPDVKSQLIGKDPDAGKDWGQEEKGVTGMIEMIRWCHQLNGHEF